MTPSQKPAGQTVYGSGDERKEESWRSSRKFYGRALGPCRRNEGPTIVDLEIERDGQEMDMKKHEYDDVGVAGVVRSSRD